MKKSLKLDAAQIHSDITSEKELERELSEYGLEKDVISRFAGYVYGIKTDRSYKHVNDRNKNFSFASQTLVFLFKHCFKSTNGDLERSIRIIDFIFQNHDYKKEINAKKQELKRKQATLAKTPEDSALDTEVKKLAKYIAVLETEEKIISSSPYRQLSIKNSLESKEHVKTFIRQSRNEQLTNRFLLALQLFPELTTPKIAELNYRRTLDNGFTLEVLGNETLQEIPTLGVTNRCCLNLASSGTKYLYYSLFNQNASFFVIRNPEGKIVASSLIDINDGVPHLYHIDISPLFKDDPAIISSSANTFLKDITEITGHPPVIFFGEATLLNLELLSIKEAEELNERIKRTLVENEFPIEEIEASIGSGRTDVGLYPFLAYALENINSLPPSISDEISEVIKVKTGLDVSFDLRPGNPDDVFRISQNEGHGLSQVSFATTELDIEQAKKVKLYTQIPTLKPQQAIEIATPKAQVEALFVEENKPKPVCETFRVPQETVQLPAEEKLDTPKKEVDRFAKQNQKGGLGFVKH